jgi:uncharacterized membrane protein HdeD (DUF308 family)
LTRIPDQAILNGLSAKAKEWKMANNTVVDKGLAPGSLMLHALAKNWWLMLLRGLASILFGILAFTWPGLTILSLIILYGAFALVDGAFAVIAAIMGGASPTPRWWLAVVGLFGVAAGIATFAWPGLTAILLLTFIGAWALARGVFEIIGAIRLRKEIDNEWMLILSGAVSVLFGLAMLVRPGAGALALIWVIGFYAMVSGVLLVGLAFRLKKHPH